MAVIRFGRIVRRRSRLGLSGTGSRTSAIHLTSRFSKRISIPDSYLGNLWLKRLITIHFAILSTCVLFRFWLPLNSSHDGSNQLLWSPYNQSLNSSNYLWKISDEQCSSSSFVLTKNIESYVLISRSVVILSGMCYIMFIIIIVLYLTWNVRSINDRRTFFWRGMLILSVFCISSMCNQLTSTMTCRPMEMIFNPKYLSMLLSQTIGSIACFVFAYEFGRKFAPLFYQFKLSTVSKEHSSKIIDTANLFFC